MTTPPISPALKAVLAGSRGITDMDRKPERMMEMAAMDIENYHEAWVTYSEAIDRLVEAGDPQGPERATVNEWAPAALHYRHAVDRYRNWTAAARRMHGTDVITEWEAFLAARYPNLTNR